jgi:hypothetical protein
VGQWVAVPFIFAMLASACKIYLNTGCWKAMRPGGAPQLFLVDVHVSLYAGWLTAACIAFFSIALRTLGSNGAEVWGIIMLLVALFLVTYIQIKHRDPVWGSVLAWASIFINSKQRANGYDAVANTAIVVCVISAIVSVAVGVKRMKKIND